MTIPLLPAIALLLALGAPPATGPCATPAHRQFDFWVGDWKVSKPDGKPAGANRITSILGGCALREEWTGASGTKGTSLNMYDEGAKKWRQTWVDDGGTALLLTGELSGGKMVLQGDTAGESGQTVRQRITWTPLSGGRVQQLWDSSGDGGKTWKTEFDGIYAPVGSKQ